MNFIKNNKFNLFIAVLYLIITVFTMFHHEIWRDEAQVWCIVRDCGLFETFQRIRLEGHPALWYLILMPFAKLGFPVISMQIMSLIAVFTAVLFLLFKSPFNKFEKIIICFSAGMLYFLPTIARNYSLVPIFLFLIAYIYPKRNEKPFLYSVLLILLSNTHMLMQGICMILFLIFGAEQLKYYIKNKNIKVLIPVFIILLNFLILFLMFNGISSDNHAVNNYMEKVHNELSLPQALNVFASTFFLFPLSLFEKFNSVIFYLLFLIFLTVFIINDKKIFFILFSAFLYHFLIYYYIWFDGIVYQKAFLLLLITVFCYWICYEKKNKILSSAFCILFTINLLFSPFSILFEYNFNFSSAKQTADFINKNLKDEKIFYIETIPFVFTPLSAYLPDKKLYHDGIGKFVSYHDFLVTRNDNPQAPQYKYLIRDVFDNLTPNPEKYTLIFESDEKTISATDYKEAYKIYEKK